MRTHKIDDVAKNLLKHFGALAILAKKVLKTQKSESLITMEIGHKLLVVI